jgi:2-polyprenyl-3-methyl-5-hydroxy-6-metoxy-1,4-benzoquinol methylase
MTALPKETRSQPLQINVKALQPDVDPAGYIASLASLVEGRPATIVRFVGVTSARGMLTALSGLRLHLADLAEVTIEEADFASVYEGLVDAVAAFPEYRFERLVISNDRSDRAGRGFAHFGFQRERGEPQDPATIPENKNRALHSDTFAEPAPVMPLEEAKELVLSALARWHAPTPEEAAHRLSLINQEFPDSFSSQRYWHEAVGQSFTSFFTWGHDHDFGFEHVRSGAMSTRHIEIISECLSLGFLPADLGDCEVLDIGCWTGGDVLALAGMAANVTAIEEHPASAAAAQRLCALLESGATVQHHSLYDDRPDWACRFDIIYCSGVIYHVTDPLLFLRICFAYLKPGGRLVIETKAESGGDANCAYGGILEKGWNWYSPTRTTLGRWLADAGFPKELVQIHVRSIGRLLASATKANKTALPDPAGFSRPGSWLEQET